MVVTKFFMFPLFELNTKKFIFAIYTFLNFPDIIGVYMDTPTPPRTASAARVGADPAESAAEFAETDSAEFD